MRITNVIQCTNLGGMEQASLRVMIALKARGHRIRVISLHKLGGLRALLDAAEIPAVGVGYRGPAGVFSFAELNAAICQTAADAIIMTGHNLTASIAISGVPRCRRLLACHYHHEGVMSAWQWRLLYRIARMKFGSITFPSDYVRREAERLDPALIAVSRTLRNPIPLPPAVTHHERRVCREKLGLPTNAQIVGNAGWLIPRKRFDVFLDTCAILLRKQANLMVAVAGDGTEANNLRGQARALGIADKVRWLGWLENTSDFYRSLDLVIFNSDSDALGNTPLEAMSHGVPVVASVRRGGLGEIIRHGVSGLLFDNHDVEALANAAAEVLTGAHPGLARAGRDRIAETANPAAIAAVFEQLLGGRPT